MKNFIRWMHFLVVLCACGILCIMLTSCLGKRVHETRCGDYTVYLQKGFYRLTVDYRESDINGVPNIGPYATKRSMYSINGTIRVDVDGATIQEKKITELMINGSRNYCWNLTLFELQAPGRVCFLFDGDLADFVEGRQLSVSRFVK